LDELTDEERLDYINTLTKIRKAQREILGIDYVYYFYNEDTTHHFHTWLVPRYKWMNEFGRSVESVRPVLLNARNHQNTNENHQKVMSAIEALKNGLI
jgi:diadenosine tetraphosphate (Ap4A) HIT family hydrolase